MVRPSALKPAARSPQKLPQRLGNVGLVLLGIEPGQKLTAGRTEGIERHPLNSLTTVSEIKLLGGE